MEELIAAIRSLESAVHSLDNFWFTLANLALPFTLSIIVVVQNHKQSKRNIELQNEQFKKEVVLRRYESIFEIYLAFGEVGKYQQLNDIFRPIQEGDKYFAYKDARELMNLYNSTVHNYDLATLLFGGTDDNLINVLKELKASQHDVCNKFQHYVVEQMGDISANAWDKVNRIYDEIPIGDLNALRANADAYGMFLKLTDSSELAQLKNDFHESWKMLSYEKYDVLFTKYLRIADICN